MILTAPNVSFSSIAGALHPRHCLRRVPGPSQLALRRKSRLLPQSSKQVVGRVKAKPSDAGSWMLSVPFQEEGNEQASSSVMQPTLGETV